MKIYYQTYQTKLGQGGVAWREDGVVYLSILPGFPTPPPKNYLEKKSTHAFVKHLRNYFNQGTPIPNNIPLDWSRLPELHQLVLQECRKIRIGKTITYAELAKRVGKPDATRAIGQILRKNPFAPFVPCHRVIGTRSIGGFGGNGHVELKRHMLELEKGMANRQIGLSPQA
ncbi:methylated-DNA--[protein]-cysteine S-methyltransferase [Bdellovibrionota bacterium]